MPANDPKPTCIDLDQHGLWRCVDFALFAQLESLTNQFRISAQAMPRDPSLSVAFAAEDVK